MDTRHIDDNISVESAEYGVYFFLSAKKRKVKSIPIGQCTTLSSHVKSIGSISSKPFFSDYHNDIIYLILTENNVRHTAKRKNLC